MASPLRLTTHDMLPHEFRRTYGKRVYNLSTYQDSWQFILPSLASKALHHKASWSQVNMVRDQLLIFLKSANVHNPERYATDVAGVEADWPVVREKLRYNAGMTRMMLDHGCRSRYLYKVIQQGAQAVLLEVFYGRFLSVSGKMEYYPYSDPLARYTVNESIAVNIQERTLYAQCAMLEKPKQKILICAAGLCPEVRFNGFPGTELGHEILAVDIDERNLKNIPLVFDRPLSDYGIQEYQRADLWDVCADSANAGKFDLVLVPGFLSYCVSSGRVNDLLRVMMEPLKDGGKAIFDSQLMRVDLVRCASSLGWESELKPYKNAQVAMAQIDEGVRQLGQRVIHYTPMYKGKPAALLSTMTKIR